MTDVGGKLLSLSRWISKLTPSSRRKPGSSGIRKRYSCLLCDDRSRGLPGGKLLCMRKPLHQFPVRRAQSTLCETLDSLPKESHQRKGDPGSSPRNSAGFPALLAGEGGCGTRRTNINVLFCMGGGVLLKQSSPNAPSPAALLGDSQREWCLRPFRLRLSTVVFLRAAKTNRSKPWHFTDIRQPENPVMSRRTSLQTGGALGEHCLSGERGGDFLHKPCSSRELRSPACLQRSAGTPQGRLIGLPFLWLLSFGNSKESNLPPGNPGLRSLLNEHEYLLHRPLDPGFRRNDCD